MVKFKYHLVIICFKLVYVTTMGGWDVVLPRLIWIGNKIAKTTKRKFS